MKARISIYDTQDETGAHTGTPLQLVGVFGGDSLATVPDII